MRLPPVRADRLGDREEGGHVRGEHPDHCPHHFGFPAKSCGACAGEKLAEKDRRSTTRPSHAPYGDAVSSARRSFNDLRERVGEVQTARKGRY